MSESTAANHTTGLLLQRIRGGNPAARGMLVARLQPLLQRFARGRVPQLLRHQQDTGAVVQLTWLRVLDRLVEIRSDSAGDFFAYLRTVLINALREALRRQGRSPVQGPGGGADVADSAVLPADAVDAGDWLA